MFLVFFIWKNKVSYWLGNMRYILLSCFQTKLMFSAMPFRTLYNLCLIYNMRLFIGLFRVISICFIYLDRASHRVNIFCWCPLSWWEKKNMDKFEIGSFSVWMDPFVAKPRLWLDNETNKNWPFKDAVLWFKLTAVCMDFFIINEKQNPLSWKDAYC